MKKCSFNPTGTGTSYTAIAYDSWGEVFIKTLAFFCALQDQGCSFISLEIGSVKDESDWDAELPELAQDLVSLIRDPRSPQKPKRACKGRLLLHIDKLGHYSIR